MRICLYTDTALPMLGGQELVVDALARQFGELKHEVVVVAPVPRSPLTADDGKLPYPVVRHPRFISTRNFVSWYRWFLDRAYKKYRFGVLHCHSVYPAGYVGVLTGRRHGIPVVITSHGGDIEQAGRLFKKPGLQERYMFALKKADALVSISNLTSEGYRRLLPGAQMRAIPNGVDFIAMSEPVARPSGLPADIQPKAYLLFLGRLSRHKGVDILLQSIAMLPAGARPLVVVAGAGNERAALDEQAVQLSIADRIRFVGQVTGAAKRYLLQNAIATVMPSRNYEGFPLVVLESFASGTPLIATQIPGLRDLVTPGVTGWLVAPESPPALAQVLREAAAAPLVAARMGENARKFAQERDWQSIAAQYVALFNELTSPTACREGVGHGEKA